MTHDELSRKLWILPAHVSELQHGAKAVQALRAVVELHKPVERTLSLRVWGTMSQYRPEEVGTITLCNSCTDKEYPCPTIQAIEKELG